MFATIKSACLLGLETKEIDVEVDTRPGLSNFSIVGLGDKAVQEAKDRIISAIRNSDVNFTPQRITVNLAPANIPKHGPVYDLAIAVAYLLCTDQLSNIPPKSMFLGELALDGKVREVKGALAIVAGAKSLGIERIFVPNGNITEASLVSDIKIHPVRSLRELLHDLRKGVQRDFKARELGSVGDIKPDVEMSSIKGQLFAKRGLLIAAAGWHSVLMQGPPGTGKSMLAKALAGILPDLSFEEGVECAKLHSIKGLLSPTTFLKRPFRSPHSSISTAALIGGGTLPVPGELSLAHNGVLFLDEFPEFSASSRESLRQPIEEGRIVIARAKRSVSYPSKALLVIACNPCRCGYYGDEVHRCSCTSSEIRNYHKKLSGPIIDRIDLRYIVNRIEYDELYGKNEGSTSQQMKTLAERARRKQISRQGKMNSELEISVLLEALCIEQKKLLKQIMDRFQLSPRGVLRLLRVARTIADVEDKEKIDSDSMFEAVQFRF